MFRTRDFVLLFVTIIFLVVVITATVFKQSYGVGGFASQLLFTETADTERTAQLSHGDTLDRADRMEAMRQKIAASGDMILNAPPEIELGLDETAVPTTTTSEMSTGTVTSPLLCAGHVAYAGAWSPQGLEFEEVEGSRLVYRELTVPVAINESGSSSAAVVPVSNRDVIVQLPMRSMSLGGTHCLPSDVVGIAKDGSLIRNTELPLYSVFGEVTLVGYSLDGYPIYGTSAQPVDECGGATVAGSYRYYLSNEREVILNCFVAPPATLP